MDPTLAGFLAFVRNQGVTETALPDSSPFITYAYNVASEIVNPVIQTIAPTIYMLAVYNLGMHNLVMFAPDQTGSTFFADLRSNLGANVLTMGVASSGSDQGTSTSLVVPDYVKELSLADLALLKSPWGRVYLSFAQLYTIGSWGVS